MKRFILNCYFVFYNLGYTKKPSLLARKQFWNKALMMLSVPIAIGTLSSVTLIFDVCNFSFRPNLILIIVLFFATYAVLKSLIFHTYKIDQQENGLGIDILVTKIAILQAILLYVVAFGLMLIRTQLKFGYLVKP